MSNHNSSDEKQPLLLDATLNSSSEVVITQDDYENYSTILFQIQQLKLVLKLKQAQALNSTTLKNFYHKLLLKKLFLDEKVFKSERPSASRQIDTMAELQALQASFETSKPTSSSEDSDGSEVSPAISPLQKAISPAEYLREWLIYLNTFRVNIVLWSSLTLQSIAANCDAVRGSFTSMTSKSDILNGYASVGFYVANVVITSGQALIHKATQIETDEVVNIGNYRFKQEMTNTKASTFLKQHKYKFLNDLIWAPINSFYFMNQTLATCRNHVVIGDSFCAALFFLDIFIGIYQQQETLEKFNELQLSLANAYVNDLNAQETQYDGQENIELYNFLESKKFEDELITQLLLIALHLQRNTKENTVPSLIEVLKEDPMFQAILALQEQKEKMHWEQQKDIYVAMTSTLAMSILLLSDILLDASLNLFMIGAVLGITAKLCLVVYNYYENIKDLKPGEDDALGEFRDFQLGMQILQQTSYLMIFLVLSLAVMPHIAGPTIAVTWVLIIICLSASCTLNQYLENQIENHPGNPLREQQLDEAPKEELSVLSPFQVEELKKTK